MLTLRGVAHGNWRASTSSISIDDRLEQRRLLESLSEYVIFTMSALGRIESWSARAQRTFGYSSHEMLGRHYGLLFTTEDRSKGVPDSQLRSAAEQGKAAIDGWHVRKDGSKLWCTNIVQPVFGEDGVVSGYTKVVKDITQQYLATTELRESEERLRLLIESVTEYAIFSMNPRGDITLWNTGAERLFGYSDSEIHGKHFSLLYTDSALEAGVPEAELSAARSSGRAEDNAWHIKKDGTRFFSSGHVTLLKPDADGTPRGYVKVAHDTTLEHDVEQRLRRQAYHDDLTALPNRISFSEHLSNSIERARSQSEPSFAVLYLDLDLFKSVNDHMGHAVGDDLLIAFSRLLEGCLRPGDVVARAGGDEFTVLLTDVRTLKAATSVAERIHLALRHPFSLGGNELYMTASIGIALGASSYNTPQQILNDADSAMYHAKVRGRGQNVIFDHTLPSVLK